MSERQLLTANSSSRHPSPKSSLRAPSRRMSQKQLTRQGVSQSRAFSTVQPALVVKSTLPDEGSVHIPKTGVPSCVDLFRAFSTSPRQDEQTDFGPSHPTETRQVGGAPSYKARHQPHRCLVSHDSTRLSLNLMSVLKLTWIMNHLHEPHTARVLDGL